MRDLTRLSRFAIGSRVYVFTPDPSNTYFKYNGQIGTVMRDREHENALYPERKLVQFLIDVEEIVEQYFGGTKIIRKQQMVQIPEGSGVKYLIDEEYLVHEVMES